MKKIILILLCLCMALPVVAQEAEDEASKTEEGLSLLDQGARLLFEGLLQEMEPAMEDLKGLAEEMEPRFQALVTAMGPALIDLLDKIDDFRNYEEPEVLENGDILIRRKPDAPAYVPPEPADTIDL